MYGYLMLVRTSLTVGASPQIKTHTLCLPNGECSPAPWLMAWKPNKFGIMLECSRIRPWFKPELAKNGRTTSLMWGFLQVAWCEEL